MSNPLPPVSQSFYDDNRQRFEAETNIIELKKLKESKCDHFFERKSATEVKCRKCPAGWIDNNRFIIKDGKLIGIK